MHKAIGIPGVALTMCAAVSDAASSAGAMDAAIAEQASSGRPQPPASRTGSPDLNPDGVLDRLQTQDRNRLVGPDPERDRDQGKRNKPRAV